MKNLTNQLIKIIEIFLLKNKYIYLKDYKNFSISSIKLVENIKKYVPDLKTIIDVGANRGQFLFASNKCFPSAKIFSFEPLPSMVQLINKRVKENHLISVNNLAISKKQGEIVFYESDYSHISSALEIAINNDNPKYIDAKIKEIKVKTTTLSDFFNNIKVEKPVLLKLDTQGLEKEVLEGAALFLNNVDYIVLEAAFIELYKNQPLFSEIHLFLENIGFSLLAPLDFHNGSEGKVIEMDVLYRKN